MTAELVLRPGRASLDDWRAIYRGTAATLDPISRADVEAGAAAAAAIFAEGPKVEDAVAACEAAGEAPPAASAEAEPDAAPET